jgi:hypothetical protein
MDPFISEPYESTIYTHEAGDNGLAMVKKVGPDRASKWLLIGVGDLNTFQLKSEGRRLGERLSRNCRPYWTIEYSAVELNLGFFSSDNANALLDTATNQVLNQAALNGFGSCLKA